MTSSDAAVLRSNSSSMVIRTKLTQWPISTCRTSIHVVMVRGILLLDLDRPQSLALMIADVTRLVRWTTRHSLCLLLSGVVLTTLEMIDD